MERNTLDTLLFPGTAMDFGGDSANSASCASNWCANACASYRFTPIGVDLVTPHPPLPSPAPLIIELFMFTHSNRPSLVLSAFYSLPLGSPAGQFGTCSSAVGSTSCLVNCLCVGLATHLCSLDLPRTVLLHACAAGALFLCFVRASMPPNTFRCPPLPPLPPCVLLTRAPPRQLQRLPRG